jgi:hypothetical protein
MKKAKPRPSLRRPGLRGDLTRPAPDPRWKERSGAACTVNAATHARFRAPDCDNMTHQPDERENRIEIEPASHSTWRVFRLGAPRNRPGPRSPGGGRSPSAKRTGAGCGLARHASPRTRVSVTCRGLTTGEDRKEKTPADGSTGVERSFAPSTERNHIALARRRFRERPKPPAPPFPAPLRLAALRRMGSNPMDRLRPRSPTEHAGLAVAVTREFARFDPVFMGARA